MGLNFADFPSLGDDEGAGNEGLKFLGTDKLTPETTAKLSEAAETKQVALTKGQRSAVTRRINKAKKAGPGAIEALLLEADAAPEVETSQMIVAALRPTFPAAQDYSNQLIDKIVPEQTGMESWAAAEAQGELEVDPSGKPANEAGAKLDAGKVDMAQILASFARALFAVGSVGQFGAEKYSYEGFLEVEHGVHRYSSAGIRHFLKQFIEGPIDSDSKMHHLSHEAWNALAKLELYCREHNISGEFKVIPQAEFVQE